MCFVWSFLVALKWFGYVRNKRQPVSGSAGFRGSVDDCSGWQTFRFEPWDRRQEAVIREIFFVEIEFINRMEKPWYFNSLRNLRFDGSPASHWNHWDNRCFTQKLTQKLYAFQLTETYQWLKNKSDGLQNRRSRVQILLPLPENQVKTICYMGVDVG